jgi:hypothetical protein
MLTHSRTNVRNQRLAMQRISRSKTIPRLTDQSPLAWRPIRAQAQLRMDANKGFQPQMNVDFGLPLDRKACTNNHFKTNIRNHLRPFLTRL